MPNIFKKMMKMDCKKNSCNCSNNNAFYGLGLVAALIYNLQHAASLGDGIFGILKASVWPAFFVYRIMEYLGM